MPNRAIVLAANILIRTVLGKRVRDILETHADTISFFAPEAYAEAEEHLAVLITKPGGDPAKAVAVLRSIAALGTIIEREVYCDFEAEARQRLGTRDPEDWPIL